MHYPSGKISNPEPAEDPTVVAIWPRTREAARLLVLDPRMGSQLGRLYVTGRVTQAEYEAGDRWAGIVRDYKQRSGLEPGYPRPGAVEVGRGRSVEPDPFHPRSEERARRAASKYDNAFVAVTGISDGIYVMRALSDLVIRDEALTTERVVMAKRGLHALALHFGLTARRNSE